MSIIKNKIANLLTGLTLTEVSTYALSNNYTQNKHMNTKLDLIHLKNSVSSEYNVLRTWLLPSLLEVLKNNKHNEYPQIIFEMSTIFKKGSSETGTEENERLCILLHNKTTTFTEIKQVLDYLFNSLNIKYTIKETEHPSFIPGRTARVSVNNKEIAYIGEIHPKVLKNFDLELPVAALELNLTELFT
jgi:phenylalanyl-tRNA synthetase beta chain